jgi:RNA polymerase sigma-70 factor (ECF subfamily)
MADPSPDMARQLADARAGSKAALERMLADCQGYLLAIARRELDPQLQAKGGASDLLQETLFEAYRDFERFQGTTEAELLGWLRRLLLNNLANFTRRFRDTAKRRAGAEVTLEGNASSANWASALDADLSSPSERAVANEQSQALQRALERLPEDYRRVILLRYQNDLSFEEIGRLMERSANAAEKLWARAIDRLQQELGPPS